MKSPRNDPWFFDEVVPSPDKQYTLTYKNVGEIAMSAPCGGTCELEANGKIYQLDAHFGGPAIWNTSSDRIALPVWTRTRNQKLAVIDINEMTLSTSEKNFRVIQLEGFQHNIITGIDSPIYKSEKIEFDIEKEAFEELMHIR